MQAPATPRLAAQPPILSAADTIVLCVCSLFVIGVVMVTSAGLSVTPDRAESIIDTRTIVYAALGGLALLIGAHLPIVGILRLPSAPWLLLGFSIVLLLLAYVPPLAHPVNASYRWVRIGPASLQFTFQPSEVIKWSLPLILAAHLVRLGPDLRCFGRGFLPTVALLFLPCGIVLIEDLGTAVLIAAAGLLLIYTAGAKLWHILLLFPLPVAAVVAAIIHSPYRLNRITAFLDPYADPQGTGYHIIQSLAAIANGELVGRGLGNGIQKFDYLPEDTTDFIFAVICEELGIVGAVIVMLLYVLLVGAAVRIAQRLTDPIARLIAVGVIFTFSLQVLMNLFVVTGLAPTKGIALPLISSGGTGWILTAGSLGLLLALDRRERTRAAAGTPA